MQPESHDVRPTRRSLDDLGVALPDLGLRLSSLTHPLVVKAQSVPQQASHGSAERVRSITDRTWLKVKVGHQRGVAGDLKADVLEAAKSLGQYWWLCAAGVRQDDSPQLDFYARLKKASFAAGENTCSSDFLLPSAWDYDRLTAEAGVNAARVLRERVLVSAALSLRFSTIEIFTVGERDVRVRIHAHKDGRAYVVIGATGSGDSTFFVALLSAIPGVDYGDWMPEPHGTLPIELEPGEIVWSTMLPTETQELLLDVDVSAFEEN